MITENESLQILRFHRYKVTQPRKLVLQVLERSTEPLSPYDIQKLLQKKGKSLNPVTIYRILNLFCSLDLAHRVLSQGGFVKCTLGEEEGCHLFVIYRRCGRLQEFVNEVLCQQESEIVENLGFHTEHHLSEVSGLCSKCRAGEP